MTNDEKEIRKLVETWRTASMAGDVDTVLGLMTDDVVFLGAGRLPMIGKQSFADASKAMEEQPFEMSGSQEIEEINVLGEWAYMRTKLSVVATPKDGGRPVRREGYTLTIFRKENGKWLLARDANMLAVVPDAGD